MLYKKEVFMRRIALVCLFSLACFFSAAQDIDDLELIPGVQDFEEPEPAFTVLDSGDLEFVAGPGGLVITAYSGDAVRIAVPGEIQGAPVVAIGPGAFEGKGIIALVLPDSVERIGNRAFAENQIAAVALPPSLRVIGAWAFAWNQLAYLEIPDSVTAILYRAFESNRLVFVNFGSGDAAGLTAIRDFAFAHNLIGGVVIPDSVTVIGDSAFEDNRIANVVLGGGVIAIGSRAFAGNRLRSVNIPSSLDSAGPGAFGDGPTLFRYDGRTVTGQQALERELRRRPLAASFLRL
jgi:hypothetical protein